MSVRQQDIYVYGSANMPEVDGTTTGGANSAGTATVKKVVFDDVPDSPAGNIEVVSDAAGDTTQTITVTGRNAAGEIVSEGIALNGTTEVAASTITVWERLLKAVKSATCAGNVAVKSVTPVISDETAQGGGTDYITLAAGNGGATDAYRGMVIKILSGTGSGQIREITGNNNTSKKCNIRPNWSVNPDGTSHYEISEGMFFNKTPDEVDEVRRPFYNVAADVEGGASRVYYEKVFIKNEHATLSLTNAVVEELTTGLYQKVDFALESSLDGTNSTADRLNTAPTGIEAWVTADGGNDDVVGGGNLAAGESQGVWLRLTLAAGDAAQKSVYSLRTRGQSV